MTSKPQVYLPLLAVVLAASPATAPAQQATITAAVAAASRGTPASALVSVEVPPGQEVATLQFNLTVVPTAGAPALQSTATWVNQLEPPRIAPSLVLNDGNSVVLVGRLQEIAPTLSGRIDIGTLTVPMPASARVGDRYRIEIRRPSGTTAGLAEGSTKVTFTVAPGEIEVAQDPCPGDCSNDHQVDVAELVRGVNLQRDNAPAQACYAFDRDFDQRVSLAEVLTAIGVTLTGCESPTP